LTANRQVLAHPELIRIAQRHGRTPAQVVFAFALAIGMIALTGTSDVGHMRADLEAAALDLDPAEVDHIERLANSRE
jgi:diketogulonate reductase-like aldo/keto reductase